ncbi:FecR domain-containing protein [Alloalcanivorax mobilis]|uniref:FecR domain-containing protein n=1 Tax=Alloalcanivorax mobilis TaxID=2019569 RepID=UPI000B5B1BDA|nr:FecR domain-containing protein [Alloalcanivorax mobilis]ASK33086.1 iron dicitrate transport regulator FecR [Alcanivorax sp. N3-2A]ASK36904.1 iron dicitrate transport regulator FecR [Alcanivorax sp. N3-2A]|tara:strand:+ start:7821 stop:8798 length:978 start_codon:yes stop_codon:yes gene_type:complete
MTASDADRRALEQAAHWFAVLNDERVSASDRAGWQRWLQAQPAHRRAWDCIDAVGQRLGALREDQPERAARTLETVRGQRLSRRQALKSLAVLAAGGTLGWAAWRTTPLPRLAGRWQADYRTAVGEVKSLRLADGTRLWLGTDSALNVDYRADARQLTLVAGEVLVSSGHDVQRRPLRVATRDGEVEALGTRFTVRRTGDDTALAVSEGAVRVAPAGNAERVRVPAGSRTRFSATTVAPLEATDPAGEAWTQGLLLADDWSLGALVAELGRYRHGHLGVEPEVAGLRVMGAYPLGDTDRALAMLERALPVRVRRILPWWVTVSGQ